MRMRYEQESKGMRRVKGIYDKIELIGLRYMKRKNQ